MARTNDSIALNDWYVVATVGHIKPGTKVKTLLLGQRLEIVSDASGQLTCFELRDDGAKRSVARAIRILVGLARHAGTRHRRRSGIR